MWRFLSSVSRAFKNHVHSPRPSAGLYVEEEQEALELNEKFGCPFTGRRKSSDGDEHKRCSARVLSSLFANKNNQNKNNERTCNVRESLNFDTGKKDGSERKRSCHYDFWGMFHGSHRMLEALSWGSAVLLGADAERRYYKSRLLLRILFTTPYSGTTVRSIKTSVGICQIAALQQLDTGQVTVRDALVVPQIATADSLETETLDSAVEEFQSLCTEYTAKSESLLAIEAACHGDFSAAVEHLKSSCALGNTSACFNLGLCYETGSGVLQDFEKARHYYELAAKEGHSMALYNLGLLCMKCSNDNAEQELARAGCDCGCNRVEGLGLLEKAAKLGLAEAQTYLGIYHIEESNDVDRAVPYFKAAAGQNDVDAQYFLAICYEQGWGVDVNECRAAQLYSQAASAGHEVAMYNLAVFNEHGLGGLPENKTLAFELYQKSANLGCEQARRRLENMKTHETDTEDWKTKVELFRQLYLQHHKDENIQSSHHRGISLSPSASSPNLTGYFHKDEQFFFNNHSTHITDFKETNIFDLRDDGRVSHQIQTRDFHLGSDGEDDNDSILSPHSERSSGDESFESITYDMFTSLKNLHKSQSYPNFSVLASNI